MKTPDTEVPAKARRRRFAAECKQKILREAQRCPKPGEMGALLRREGLYSSHLLAWRAARAKGERAGLEAKRRDTKPRLGGGQAQRVAETEREVVPWKRRVERAEILVELQETVASILGTELDENGDRR